MTFNEYLANLGFGINPFQYSNADKEIDIIGNYFIKPDYFEDIWGNPYNPVSNIVYAPRGGGKTAQRIMVEKRAKESDDILTITYTNHDLSAFSSINEITLSYHLTYLNRLLLLSFFNRINDESFDFNSIFSFSERQYIYKLARIYLFETPASFPNQAISCLKTFEDHIVDIWKGFKEPIVNVVKQITKSKGLEIDLSNVEIDKKLEFSHKNNFFNINSLLNKAGYNSIMVLVDKVDEQNLTGNNPLSSFTLICDLIKDLELLETPNISFKFFLWDALRPFTMEHARPDRVFSYDLVWTWSQIQTMLSKRVSAYSDGRVTNFTSLFKNRKSLGRVILFSELSPRDCVRICNRILSEQFKFNPSSIQFEEHIVDASIESFCKEKAQELITNSSNLNYLIKMNKVSFTIEELVTSKLASNSPAVRNIILPWTSGGYLKKIGLVNRKNAKAVNEYALQEIRLAFIACPKLNLDDFIANKVRRCNHQSCGTIFYRNFDVKTYPCPVCNTLNE
ncbi:P-loop ATPase, Sll1717 family [Flavobacterium collinsii]|uniref:Uncharacterized protein n=1 Tax=Flavobacterium collinsii TaxID=1114861 RepID=A0A9W4TGN5_9FLAO|nr:hypothetical protein [Flavobacterium collinsii]CAI2765697.1 conserved protein of unknown function [Flavobacterium collinsii]